MAESNNTMPFVAIFDETDVYFSGTREASLDIPIYGDSYHEAYFATEEDMEVFLELVSSREEQREQ